MLTVLGVLSITETIATGRRPGVLEWGGRFARNPKVAAIEASSPPAAQFRNFFPDAARVAALEKAPSQIKAGEAIYERFDAFFRSWFDDARKGAPPCPEFARDLSAEQMKAYAELLNAIVYDTTGKALSELADMKPEPLVAQLCERLNQTRHPDWQPARAFSTEAVKTAIYGRLPAEKEARAFGLYAVIREARGWETFDSKPHEANMLVRDLLWVRPSKSARPSPGTAEAIYFSGIEDKAYFAQCTAVGRGFKFDGATRDAAEQTMQMICSELDSSAQPRLALLTGATRSARRHGAWKVLLSKLGPDVSWPLEHRIIVAQADHGDVEALIASLAKDGQIGAIPREGDDVHHPRWRTYKALTTLWSTGAANRAMLEVLRGSVVEAAQSGLGQAASNGADAADTVADAIIEVLAEHWPMLEPGQVILMPPDEFVTRQKETAGFDVQSLAALFAPVERYRA